MVNPFDGEIHIDSECGLYERSEQIKKLRGFIKKQTDAVIFGPEGSGKSALLHSCFNNDFRRKMALEHILIYQGAFPNNLDGEESYGFFIGAIRSAVEFLEFSDMADQMSIILQSLNAIQYDTKQSCFDQYLNKIRNFGFRMLFVLDNFENFTSSPNIKPEHHDLLCGMLNAKKLQLIVATNYDFNTTSLPVGIHNSLLLTRLRPHHILMTPLSVTACQELLDHVAQEAEDDFRFTAFQIQSLHCISGGIPLLLYTAAKHAFALLYETAFDDHSYCFDENAFEEEVQARTLKEAFPILKRWCKISPDEQLDFLSTLQENQSVCESAAGVASTLEDRGLLEKSYDISKNGRKIFKEGYIYNSGLFREFCHHQEWLDEIRKNNPLRSETVPAVSFDPLSLIQHGPSGSVYIENVHVDNSVTYQNTFIAENGFARLFDILNLNRDELSGKLLEIFNKTAGALPEVVDEDKDVEETANRISAMFIPKEVESGNLDTCREEQKTLEKRFQSVRRQVDPLGTVDDELLASLSPKCRLYLQIAFVVDDALSSLSDFHLGDLSAQVVMYGKVLEQQLKDNLYKLFHKDLVLRNIDVFTDISTPLSHNTFGYMKLSKTSIGNYMSLMHSQSQRLGVLCKDNNICSGPEDAQWWKNLSIDVDAARNLRNCGDHAGSETSQNDLESMRNLLFGSGNILRRCKIGSLLAQALWPENPTLVQPAVSSVIDDKISMVGQIVQMTDIEVTSRNSIRGIIAGSTYGVSVSRKHLEARQLNPNSFLGKTIQVKLIQWDPNPNAQKFNAELT